MYRVFKWNKSDDFIFLGGKVFNIKKQYLGAGLVCLAATMWGFDGIVLTPRLYQLNVAYVVFVLHLLPLIGMSILFGKSEIINIKKLSKEDLFFYFLSFPVTILLSTDKKHTMAPPYQPPFYKTSIHKNISLIM